MRDGKAFASLSSGLLARKGQARPAMRPQGFAPRLGQQDDLGWNDMGYDVPRAPAPVAAVAPAMPPVAELPQVLRQQEEIAREFAAPAEPARVEAEPVELASVEPATIAPPPVAAQAAPAAEAQKPKRSRRVAAPRKAAVILPRTHKAAFTLRLDTDRHLLLRLACAVQHRSAQQIVVEALDQLLAELPDVARLAQSLPKQD